MNKVLKKVGLSAVVATFVFGMASTSSALVPQDPDNETANITTHADVFVEAQNDATYSETEKYTVVLDNTTRNGAPSVGGNTGKTGLTYDKDFKATNGQTHVVSDFAAVGSATTTTPNIKTSNKITFNTLYEGLNAGTFTGSEKIAYQRCQGPDSRQVSAFCGPVGASVPKATADIAAGSNFDVQYAAVTTGADVTAIAYSPTDTTYSLLPSLNYNIDARGTGALAQNDNAVGTVKAGMKANITEYNGTNKTTKLSYEQHTAAKGLIKFAKDMHYKSAVKDAASATPNINKVP